MDELLRAGLHRRNLLAGASGVAALGATGLSLPSRPALAQAAPWATAPRSRVDKVNFVVWTYGDIYTKIAQRFQQDWGVPVESTTTASSAGFRGATDRFASRSSRAAISFSRPARVTETPFSFNCL